ncbi:MAG: FHA domain-containing protein [Streptosporangiaceae bacterium]
MTAPVVRPMRGDGIVACQGGLMLVVDGADSDAGKLLAVLAEVAAAGGNGRDLAHRVAQILAGRVSRQHACAVAGRAEGGVAVLVSGAASASVTGPGGEVRLDGLDALTWTDRLIGGQVDQLELRLPQAGPADPRWRLDSGVVPGGGLRCRWPATPRLRLVPPAVPAAQHDVEGPTARGQQPAVAVVTVAENVRQQPFESVLLIPSGEPVAAPGPAQPEPNSRPLVWGADCKNGHFNDPRAQYCGVCGIGMVQLSLVPRQSHRPPLGLLLLDDGMTLRLDTDYVIGRSPEPAPEVLAGTARPVRLTDSDGSVSRRHVRISLDQWDVRLTDLGSVNGTFIEEPETPMRPLHRGETVTMRPGTKIQVGTERTFRYESHRKC